MRQGSYKLVLYPDKSPDFRSTPGLSEGIPCIHELYKFSTRMEKFDLGEYPKED